MDLPASHRLGTVLEILDQKFPGILGASAEYQWRHGSSDVVIAVNDTIIEPANPDLVLTDGDHITLLPPLGGGECPLSF